MTFDQDILTFNAICNRLTAVCITFSKMKERRDQTTPSKMIPKKSYGRLFFIIIIIIIIIIIGATAPQWARASYHNNNNIYLTAIGL